MVCLSSASAWAITPTKIEVVVFHSQLLDSELTWHVAGKLLPVSASFKYLGPISSVGDMVPAEAAADGNGAKASLIAS